MSKIQDIATEKIFRIMREIKMKSRKEHEITGEHLYKILSDPEFVNQIKIMGLSESLKEWAFEVYQNVYSPDFQITDASEGSIGSTQGRDLYEVFSIEGSNEPSNPVFQLIGIHSHPNNVVCPSMGDLKAIRIRRDTYLEEGLEVSPIQLIVGRDPNAHIIDTIIVQRNLGHTPGQRLLQAMRSLDGASVPSKKYLLSLDRLLTKALTDHDPIGKVVSVLEDSGFYNALHLRYDLDPKEALPKEDIERLRKFEFTIENTSEDSLHDRLVNPYKK